MYNSSASQFESTLWHIFGHFVHITFLKSLKEKYFFLIVNSKLEHARLPSLTWEWSQAAPAPQAEYKGKMHTNQMLSGCWLPSSILTGCFVEISHTYIKITAFLADPNRFFSAAASLVKAFLFQFLKSEVLQVIFFFNLNYDLCVVMTLRAWLGYKCALKKQENVPMKNTGSSKLNIEHTVVNSHDTWLGRFFWQTQSLNLQWC